ncbi:MAG: NAD(+) synthase, partial [Eggerthellaceae bacterium]|nr:NAD(+) synthase [Eggerthellaceae bacterium]
LGIESFEIGIGEPFAAFERVLGPACGGALDGLAAENTQARCRMVCLMALSNKHGWMLVNTGNRSEALMGYCTLYGDMAGAFAPIGSLYKHEVRDLGRYINELFAKRGQKAPIPENVFAKPPSAELSPDQSDEESLGLDYDTLDGILAAHFDEGLDADQVAARGFDPALAQRVITTAEAYAFKRALLPPCATIER